VIDGLGEPLDGKGELFCGSRTNYLAPRLNPMLRQPITEPLDVGVRSINALLSLGRGQRVGLFAGSGVGKSLLLGMMTRHTAADVVVVGMIGERGREVREFIEQNLGPNGTERAIVVASPADDAPLLRLRAAHMATRIAEHYRDQGQHVLLLMDSLSRFAQAQREIALAAGEAPAVRGYPASVFAKIPALVERAGNAVAGNGSLTAIYTVLAEDDDLQDPVADAVRAILDGHIVLSRALADAGQYPAIDVEASISRVMTQIAQPEHLQRAQQFKRLNARYTQIQDLLSVGAYRSGVDSETDVAIHYRQAMQGFMRQGLTESVSFAEAQYALDNLFTEESTELDENNPTNQGLASSAAAGGSR
ncbi:MAG: FliI/YscN family ATPase, partial [Pseudomonadales bacterium]